MKREASDPKMLEKMWEILLEECIPFSDRTRIVRNYMYNYVRCKKKKWDTAYFEDLFSCGAMSTQRSEGWHAILKQ